MGGSCLSADTSGDDDGDVNQRQAAPCNQLRTGIYI